MFRVVTVIGLTALALDAGATAYAQCAGPAAAKEVRSAIEAANRKFAEAFGKRDAAALAAAYSTDAQAFPPNAEVVAGRAALQKMWQSVLDTGIASVDLETTEVESAGDLAYESGTYSMKGKDGAVADRGKYVVVWKRVGGRWLLHRDIWNSSMPPAKP